MKTLRAHNSKHTFSTWYVIEWKQRYILGIPHLPSRRGLVGSVLAYKTKSQGSSPRPDNKTKYEKYFFGDFLSQQISGKNSESK